MTGKTSPATPAAPQLKAPEDWIIYDNTTTYTPVLDVEEHF